MNPRREVWVLVGMCGVAVLLSVAGLAWVFVSGMGLTIDTIFMVLVCLAMGGLFSFLLVAELKSAGMLPHWKPARSKKVAEAPANPTSGEKKE